MKKIKIPYAEGYKEIALDESKVKGVLCSKAGEFIVKESQEDIVRRSLDSPIHSQKLRDMAKDAKTVLVITSDHTRPVPSKITLPILLQEIRSSNPDVKIKILVATGFHRASTQDEMISKYGSHIMENEEVINHDSRDKENMVFKGILPSGGELWLNSLVDWADLIVSEGFIEPHFFAGFSGGRKSILPGIASEKTVFANHCSDMISNPSSRTGCLDGNMIHEDMLYAANKVGLSFILNVVIDMDKKIINSFAGHPEKAHSEGCKFVKTLTSLDGIEADIVITSNGGYPLDQNIYQTVKGMTAAEACIKPGGVIIIVSACNDGHGGDEFYKWFTREKSPEDVMKKITSIPQSESVADQWQAQILARILMKSKVIIVTDKCDPALIKNMHMMHASSVEEALTMAEEIRGKDASITVIPDGVGVIVR